MYKGKKGWHNRMFKFIYGQSNFDPVVIKKVFRQHVKEVQTYFKNKPNQILVLNVANENSYKRLCSFIGKKPMRKKFIHLNKGSSNVC